MLGCFQRVFCGRNSGQKTPVEIASEAKKTKGARFAADVEASDPSKPRSVTFAGLQNEANDPSGNLYAIPGGERPQSEVEKEYEISVRESNRVVMSVLRAARFCRDFVFELDDEGRVLTANPAAQKALGCKCSGILIHLIFPSLGPHIVATKSKNSVSELGVADPEQPQYSGSLADSGVLRSRILAENLSMRAEGMTTVFRCSMYAFNDYMGTDKYLVVAVQNARNGASETGPALFSSSVPSSVPPGEALSAPPESAEKPKLNIRMKYYDEVCRALFHAVDVCAEGITIADISDKQNRLIYANEGFKAMTGYTDEDIIDHNCKFLQGIGTDRDVSGLLSTSIRDKQTCRVELLNYRKDGSPFWNFLSISPIIEPDGRCTKFIGIQSDITLRKRLMFQNECLLKLTRVVLSRSTDFVMACQKAVKYACVGLDAEAVDFWLGSDGDLSLRAVRFGPRAPPRLTPDVSPFDDAAHLPTLWLADFPNSISATAFTEEKTEVIDATTESLLDLESQPAYVQYMNAKSAVGFPFVNRLNDRTVGAMTVYSTRNVTFTRQDYSFLEACCNLLAMCEAQHHLGKVRRARPTKLPAVNSGSSSSSASPSILSSQEEISAASSL